MALDGVSMSLLVGTREETLEVYKISRGEPSKDFVLDGHSDAINSVTTDWAANRALTVSDENTMKVWDLSKRECILTIHSFEKRDRVLAVSVSWATNSAMAFFQSGIGQMFSLEIRYNFEKVGGGACVDSAKSHGDYKKTSVPSSDHRNCQNACSAVDTCSGYDDRTEGCLLYHNLKIVGSDKRPSMTCYRKVEIEAGFPKASKLKGHEVQRLAFTFA